MTVTAAVPSLTEGKPDAGPDVAARVTAQLARDYPPEALSWVTGLSWRGPDLVPVKQIDRNAGDWSASDDKRKVASFARRIAAGWRKPVVLIRRPGVPLLYAVDGHTRITAAAGIGQPVTAYIGTAETATGPWMATHHKQLAGKPGSVIELVGPKGYVHNWHFVGPQAVGAKVFHPGLGAGTVTGHDGKTVKVRFNVGGERSFKATPGAGRGRLEKHEGAAKPPPDQLRGMSPGEKKAYVKNGTLPGRLSGAAPARKTAPKARAPAAREMTKTGLAHHMTEHHGGVPAGGRKVGPRNPTRAQLEANHAEQHRVRPDLGHAHSESAKPQSASDRLAAARKSGDARKSGTGFKGQQGETHVETYKDGSKWVSKNLPTKSDADREELAGKISDILGAGAPSIVREGDTHVHEPFVEGKVAASLYRDGMSDAQIDAAGDKLKSLLSTPEGKRIGLLDKLIGNQDRHLGNWMISPDGKPIPIDHNWSWEGTKQTISPFSDAVYGPGIELSDFPKDQMDEWQSKLAALKPGLNASQQKLLARTMKSLARFRSGKD